MNDYSLFISPSDSSEVKGCWGAPQQRQMNQTQLIQISGELGPKYFISIKSQSHPLASTVCSFQTEELPRILHS